MIRRLLVVLVATCMVLLPLTGVGAVNHEPFAQVLREYVEGGFFDYETFSGDPTAKRRLRDYLDSLGRIDPGSLGRKEALAFWVNLYNAATIRLIDKHYPVESIRDIGGWFSGPWSLSFVRVNGRTLTLDEIEHEIIRPRFQEPRIHFALVCAAKSCPPLRSGPYVAEQLDAQLTDQAVVFLESSKNRYEILNRSSVESPRVRLELSRIFYWYGEDFGGEQGMLEYVTEFFPASVGQLVERDRYRMTYNDYDWSLNQAPGPYPSPANRSRDRSHSRDSDHQEKNTKRR